MARSGTVAGNASMVFNLVALAVGAEGFMAADVWAGRGTSRAAAAGCEAARMKAAGTAGGIVVGDCDAVGWGSWSRMSSQAVVTKWSCRCPWHAGARQSSYFSTRPSSVLSIRGMASLSWSRCRCSSCVVRACSSLPGFLASSSAEVRAKRTHLAASSIGTCWSLS